MQHLLWLFHVGVAGNLKTYPLVSILNLKLSGIKTFVMMDYLLTNFVAAGEDPKVHPDQQMDSDVDQLRRFSLEELKLATDYFSNENILGSGGFGKVYKGRLQDDSLVAVKRLEHKPTPDGELQFQTTTEIINMAVHPHVLRLSGFCMTTSEKLLVYPYMANGSVASHLRGNLASISYIYINCLDVFMRGVAFFQRDLHHSLHLVGLPERE